MPSAPINLVAMGPRGFWMGGGAITNIGGTGMPGSMGASRMVVTRGLCPRKENRNRRVILARGMLRIALYSMNSNACPHSNVSPGRDGTQIEAYLGQPLDRVRF